jgi:phage gpG-like protein
MFGLIATTTDLTDRVAKAAERAAFKNFAHGAATVRKEVIDEIKITKEIVGYITRTGKDGKRRRVKIFRPSPVGTPVHSHRNKGFVRRGIKFDATKIDAVIGFAGSVYGDVMRVHEFGGQREGVTFEARPTMFPALEKSAPRFAESWRGSIGE